MKIRPFQLPDQKSVMNLWNKCGLVVSYNKPIRDIERKLMVNPEWFLVGEINGEVIATCMAGYEGHRGWIESAGKSRQRVGSASLLHGNE